MSARLGESQRDSILQPRVAESARLPWVCGIISPQPQRGCITRPFIRRRCNPVGVETKWRGAPRVARASQPWAELCNPFGVMRPAGSSAAQATLQNAVTATDRQVDALVYDLYALTPEEIQLVEGGA